MRPTKQELRGLRVAIDQLAAVCEADEMNARLYRNDLSAARRASQADLLYRRLIES